MVAQKSARFIVVLASVFIASLMNITNAMAVTAITDAVRMLY